MSNARKKIRIFSPREIAFRLSEKVRFRRERRGKRPQVEITREYHGLKDRFIPVGLFPFTGEKESVCGMWREVFPGSAEGEIALADGILENRIPVFSEKVDYGDRVDWHLDPVSGTRSPVVFYRDIDTFDTSVAGDPKRIWELNRHDFFIHLGKAYWINGDVRYFDKWRELIVSWVEENPYHMGINWESSLEMAFRSINWIWSSYFFADRLEADRELQELIFETLYLQADHISNHLSYFFSPNTHLTGEALGLLYIGRVYPAMKPAAAWVSTAVDILETELEKHILEDGGYFEMATYYHRYTIDFYLHFFLLSGGVDGPGLKRREYLKKMVRHLVLLSEPDGTIPLLGDSDGGRLLMLDDLKRNVSGACCSAAVILGDGELKSLCGSRFSEETMWLLGTGSRERFDGLAARPPVHFHSINDSTGLYCFRSGMTEDDSYTLIDCGPHGWKGCGHAHADLLSFIWYSGGEMVLTDPGTFTYTGSRSIRDQSRSSLSHNTISVNGRSQSVPGEPFRWKSVAAPKYARVRVDRECGRFEGEHDAWEEFGCGHRRSLYFLGSSLTVVIDELSVSGPLDSILYNLQFGDGKLSELSGGIFRFDGKGSGGSRYVRIIAGEKVRVDIREGAFYPDYGKRVAAPRLEVTADRITEDLMIVTLLSPDEELAGSFRWKDGRRMEGSSRAGSYMLECRDREIIAFRDGEQVLPGKVQA